MNLAGAHTAEASLFSDAQFPAHVSSIDGRHHDDSASAAPLCSCGTEAKLCTVSKDGPSQGRHFWGCAAERGAERCGFFKWCRQPPHAAQDSALVWLRLRPSAGYVVVGGDGFRPDHVRQGSVGDCWFLAALAVVASKPERRHARVGLRQRLALRAQKPPRGGLGLLRRRRPGPSRGLKTV